jgi:hypothetical protein
LGDKKTDSDAVFDVRDDAAQSHDLICRWLVALDEGSENAFVSRERLEGGVSGVLREALMTRVIELESTMLLLGEVGVDRPDPAWRELLRAWIEAAQAKSGLISAHADDAAKRLSGATARRHRADENNPQLINAIRLYRVDPVSNEPRSARTIARILRNGSGFSAFTQRRSEEALAKLIQRILKKLPVPG